MKSGAKTDKGSRKRHLEQAVSHRGLIVVESPIGFGANEFLDDLYAAVRANKLDVATIEDPEDYEANLIPGLAVIDAPLAAGLRGWRDTVSARHQAGKATVVTLPVGVSGDVLAEEPLPTVLIDGHQLRMTGPDVALAAADADIDITDGVADLVASLGDGWPAWVRSCLGILAVDRLDVVIETITAAPFRRRLVRSHLHDFTDTDRYRFAQLAHFGAFTDSAATAVGGFGFTETVLPHAPGLYRDPAGRFRFVTPVEAELTSEFGLDPQTAEGIAPVLSADGQLLPACQILIAAGLNTSAAQLLETLPGRVLDLCNQRELVAVLRVLQPLAESHPGLVLKQARAYANLAEVQASVAACEALLTQGAIPDPLRLEATIELLMYRHRSIDQAEASARIAELHTEVDHLGGPLPTRLREIEAQILGQAADNATVQAAADRFVEVASEWEYQQDRLRAAKSLRGLVIGPLCHLGQYRHGQERLAHAARLAITQSFDYGITMGLKARLDALCGDLDAFAHSTSVAQPIITETAIGWLDGYLQWAAAQAAGWRRDVPAVDRSFRNTKQMFGGLYDTDSGVVLNAEVATIFATLGEDDRAKRCLDEVRARSEQNPMEFTAAEIVVAARSGRLDTAVEMWSELDRSGLLPADRRWRLELELLVAGWSDPSGPTLAGVALEAERLGLDNLLPRLAPDLFDDGQSNLHIQLLGRFAITTTTLELEAPSAQVAELIKLLAIHDGHMTIDAVCDSLWPDSDLAIGLRRLKNLVAKTRSHLGHDALIRGRESLALAPSITTDLAEFRRSANESAANKHIDLTDAHQAAIKALETYQGHLLPDDIYNDRINARRQQLHREAVSLLEFITQGPAPHGPWIAEARRRVLADDPAVD